jgi:hypothetical protein
MLYTLITEAEEHFGSGTGSIKFAEVMTKVYSMLPAFLKTFITYDTLAGWIEDVLDKLQEEWKKKSEIPDAE